MLFSDELLTLLLDELGETDDLIGHGGWAATFAVPQGVGF
jgi:hypothetical protein